MLNKKGMSLIEVVIAIAILSLGAAVMYSGFTTIAKMMVDSKVYTENVNNQLSALNGKEVKGVTLNTSEKPVSVIISVGEDEIEVNSALTVAASVVDTVNTLNLKKLKFDEVKEKDPIIDFLKGYKGMVLKQQKMTHNERLEYYNKLIADSGLVSIGDYGGWMRNDDMHMLYFLEYYRNASFPKITDTLFERIDKIYCEQHPEVVKKAESLGESKLTWQEKKEYEFRPKVMGDLYMHGYLAQAGNVNKIENLTYDMLDDYVVYYVNTTPNIKTDWTTTLIYNLADGYWYYKIFAPNNENFGATYSVASHNSKPLSELRLELQDTKQWIKVR